MKIGYARVSNQEQNFDLQKDALIAAGCEARNIYTDTTSGGNATRPGLDNLLSKLRKGDELIVWRLDRLGRSIKNLIELINDLNSQEVTFKSLTESIDTTTSSGKLIFNIFASLAEFERNLIRERTLAGLSSARARGRTGGRPATDTDKIKSAIQLYDKKEFTVEQICKVVDISKGTLYAYLAKHK